MCKLAPSAILKIARGLFSQIAPRPYTYQNMGHQLQMNKMTEAPQ